MMLQINFKSGMPVYLQIVDQIKAAAASGALQPGEALPSIRPVAEELRVNRNTVAKAYRVLSGALDGAVDAGLIARSPCTLKGAGTERHAEMRSKDDSEHLHAVQNAMARWMDRMADKQEEYEAKVNALIAAQMELSRIMDRFLRARTNGGEN